MSIRNWWWTLGLWWKVRRLERAATKWLELLRKRAPAKPPSYHDLHITTPTMPRRSIFNLPFRIEVTCTRAGGWQVWAKKEGGLPDELVGAEYDYDLPLILDVAGHVICDSMTTAAADKAAAEEDPEESPPCPIAKKP